MATENQAGSHPENKRGGPGKPSRRSPPKTPEKDDLKRAAEQALNEATEAVWQAICARARLYAPAPLDHAENRLATARDHFAAGAYREARMVAQQALSSADQAVGHAESKRQIREEQKKHRLKIWIYIALGLLAIILGGPWVVQGIRSRQAPSPGQKEPLEPQVTITDKADDPAAPGKTSTPPPAPPEAPGPASAKPPPPVPPAKEPGRFATVKVDRLNVRDVPGGRYLDQLPRGRKLPIIDTQGGWLQVDLGNGRTGWIAERYTEESSGP